MRHLDRGEHLHAHDGHTTVAVGTYATGATSTCTAKATCAR
ncbi:hypothetical protein ACIGFK_14350 [Streptomyces sp. NPDC085524]